MGTHNVVYVATQNNSVYAFDADSNAGAQRQPALWQVNLNGVGETPEPTDDMNSVDVVPQAGITATPVIDATTGTIFVEAKSKSVSGITNRYFQRLHALDITTGAEKFNGPTLIANTAKTNTSSTAFIYTSGPTSPGTGTSGDSGGGVVTFNARQQLTRSAVALLNGIVYLQSASHGDNNPYHGWLLGYNATNVAQRLSSFNTTPNGSQGGFWYSGGTFAAEPSGNFFYALTGNGNFNATVGTISSTNNFSMSALKFAVTNAAGTNVLVDYFAPLDEVTQNNNDLDFSSGAPIVLPDSAGSALHPHLLAFAPKNGDIYLLDRDNLGQYSTTTNRIAQTLTNACGQVFGAGAFWNNMLYYVGTGDNLTQWKMVNGLVTIPPVRSTNAFVYTYSGNKSAAVPSVSSSGGSNGIVWVVDTTAYAASGPGILYAYNATNVAQALYSSSAILARDNPGPAVKYTTPVVANGKVYISGQYTLAVFGNATFAATPVIGPSAHLYTNSTTITITDATPGATIYFTIDGSAPTTNSPVYTNAFQLTTSSLVQAIAVLPGSVNSGAANASLHQRLWPGQRHRPVGDLLLQPSRFQHPPYGFTVSQPCMSRIDPIIDFSTWGTTEPGPGVGTNTFLVRWNGCVQPRYGETYTFYLTSDDGAHLYVNGQLLINQYTVGAHTNSGAITLNAQQLYNMQVDYFQSNSASKIKLEWSSPSTPRADIPQTQLYPYTNTPPSVALTGPTNSSSYTASASVTVSAQADAPYNPVSKVNFYLNGSTLLGSVSNVPYAVTATGLAAGGYSLTAVAVDGSGLSSTSAAVNITVTGGHRPALRPCCDGPTSRLSITCRARPSTARSRRCFPKPGSSLTPPAWRQPPD